MTPTRTTRLAPQRPLDSTRKGTRPVDSWDSDSNKPITWMLLPRLRGRQNVLLRGAQLFDSSTGVLVIGTARWCGLQRKGRSSTIIFSRDVHILDGPHRFISSSVLALHIEPPYNAPENRTIKSALELFSRLLICRRQRKLQSWAPRFAPLARLTHCHFSCKVPSAFERFSLGFIANQYDPTYGRWVCLFVWCTPFLENQSESHGGSAKKRHPYHPKGMNMWACLF